MKNLSRTLLVLVGALMLTYVGSSAQSKTPGASETSTNPEVTIVSRPELPYIERRGTLRLVNFDLLLENSSAAAYKLVSIQLTVFDHSGKLEIERELNQNGKPPALDIVGQGELGPGGVLDIFQPFYAFDSEVELTRLHYKLLLMKVGHPAPPISLTADKVVEIDIQPRDYRPAAFCLPVRGRILVHDGHDFYSHHRRYSLAGRYKSDPATAVSANLFAYDFVLPGESGELFKGDPQRKESWFSYGAQVFAPGAGTVVEEVSDLPENSFDGVAVKIPAGSEAKDPSGFGNHIAIQHPDGRVSWLLHLQPSARPSRVGDQVRTGQSLGRIGFSGDSLFPHLHYTVTRSANYPSQGVPSYFQGFERILGNRHLRSSRQIDTGDLVESTEDSCGYLDLKSTKRGHG